jgi:hypothetical protein
MHTYQIDYASIYFSVKGNKYINIDLNLDFLDVVSTKT